MGKKSVCYWLGGARKVAREPVFVCLDLHSETGEIVGDTRAIDIPAAFEGNERAFADRIAEAFAMGADVHPENVTYDSDSEEYFGRV